MASTLQLPDLLWRVCCADRLSSRSRQPSIICQGIQELTTKIAASLLHFIIELISFAEDQSEEDIFLPASPLTESRAASPRAGICSSRSRGRIGSLVGQRCTLWTPLTLAISVSLKFTCIQKGHTYSGTPLFPPCSGEEKPALLLYKVHCWPTPGPVAQ